MVELAIGQGRDDEVVWEGHLDLHMEGGTVKIKNAKSARS